MKQSNNLIQLSFTDKQLMHTENRENIQHNIIDMQLHVIYTHIIDLKNKGIISTRTYKACMHSGLFTICDIVKHYQQNKMFLNIRNCGLKTDRELIELSLKHLNLINEIGNQRFNIFSMNTVYTLEDLKIMENMSLKTLDLCQKNDINDINDMVRFFETKYLLHNTEHYGEDVIQELQEILKKHVYDMLKYNVMNTPRKIIYNINQRFDIVIENYIPEFEMQLKEKKVSFLKIIETVFKYAKVYEKNRIFMSGLCSKSMIATEKIAEMLEVSRETVRTKQQQLTKELFYDESSCLSYLRVLLHDFIDKSLFKSEDELVIINKQAIEKLNKKNDTNFTDRCIISILKGFYSDYYLINDTILELNNNPFRINKQIATLNQYFFVKTQKDAFYIINFLKFFRNLKEKKRNVDITFSKHIIMFKCIPEYKSDYEQLQRKMKQYFLSPDDRRYKELFNDEMLLIGCKYNSQYKLFRRIGCAEFNLVKGNDDELILKRNKNREKYKYVIDVLKKLNRPSHVSEIHFEIEEIYPHLQFDKKTIKVICNRFTGVFISFGRNSIYGLKEWEQERNDIKGGTIKNIIIEFLKQENKAVHIDEIVQYVTKYRQTNKKSVYSNMKMDKKDVFKFLNGGYILLQNGKGVD